MKFVMSETGIRKLAENLFKSNSTKALQEAQTLVMRYKNGAGMVEIMQGIREAKLRMGIKPKPAAQPRLEGM